MSSPERIKRKKKKPPPTPQSNTQPSLPNDLLLSCIAPFSRLYYPTLSLVSKSFRSLIASPELYKARSLLSNTESCLYVCVQSYCVSGLTWYTLCRKPNKTIINETKSSGYVLAKLPIPDSPRGLSSRLVAVGSKIYNIGGSDGQCWSCSRVTVLDCRSHTLSEAPSLRVELRLFSASVVDGKIYVAGCGNDGGSGLKNPFQVLDTRAQVWDLLPSCETDFLFFQKTASIGGKFHVVTIDNELAAYDPKKGKWDAAGRRVGWHMNLGACCEIGNVLYAASASAYASEEGVFLWYDTVEGVWRDVTGLVGLPNFTCKSRVKLADYGGKMGVLWEEEVIRFQPLPCGRREPWPRTGYMETKIWCAEIALERRNSWEIWGKVEWLDHVLTVPAGSEVVKLLAATL